MEELTLQQHRNRIDNINEAERSIISCMRRHRIHDYIQGHIYYNLGDYPYPYKIEPTEYDYRILHECAERGAGLIHLHEDWNDALRILGADKYNSHDPEGMKHFLNLCHGMGLKVMAYASLGYMFKGDPDFRESFKYPGSTTLDAIHFHYYRNDPNSPTWVDYIMPKMEEILYKYDFDGLYNDWDILDLNDTEDILTEMYSIIKAHKKIFKLHVGRAKGLPYDTKVYDYLWNGERVKSIADTAKTRNHTPYCVPCPDYRYMPNDDLDFVFAQYIPFMQFPMLTYGRPVTGMKVEMPGVEYTQDEMYQFFKRVGKYYNAHPNGPYVYSEWSAIPDNPNMSDRWFYYLDLYKPMTTEGTVCHLNIGENTLLRSEIPEGVFVSLFSNEKQYIVISNLSDKPYEVVLNDKWHDRVMRSDSNSFTVAPRRILFLVKCNVEKAEKELMNVK